MKYLYPAIAARSARLVSGRLGASAMTNSHVHERGKLMLHALERGAQQFAARDARQAAPLALHEQVAQGALGHALGQD